MPRTRTSPATDTETALLDSARAVFVDEGLGGLSLRRVAERAGCTTMAVYTRFGGKQGLVEALFDEGFERLREAQAAVDSALVGVDRVLALCLAYRRTAHAYPHHYALMLGRMSGAFQPSAPSRERSRATLQTLIEAVLATLEAPVRMAARRQKAEAVAYRLFAFCHGWVSLELAGFAGDEATQLAGFTSGVVGLLNAS